MRRRGSLWKPTVIVAAAPRPDGSATRSSVRNTDPSASSIHVVPVDWPSIPFTATMYGRRRSLNFNTVARVSPRGACDDMPVVQTRHILDKLRAESHLAPVCEWLNKSKHLPIEGTHYAAVDFIARVGEWNVAWYGIRGLVSDYV
jgi:hypothetical protein